jgi:hypothetical protein
MTFLTQSPCQLLRNHNGCCHAGLKRFFLFLFLLIKTRWPEAFSCAPFSFFSFREAQNPIAFGFYPYLLFTGTALRYDPMKLVHMDPSTFLPKERKAGVKALKNTRASLGAITTRNITTRKPQKWIMTGKRRPTGRGSGTHVASLTRLRWKLLSIAALSHHRTSVPRGPRPTQQIFFFGRYCYFLGVGIWEKAPVDGSLSLLLCFPDIFSLKKKNFLSLIIIS